MPAPLDFTGQRFGKLTPRLLLEDRDKEGRRLWLCDCDCGGTIAVLAALLRNGHTKSCGCLARTGRPHRPSTKRAMRQAYKEKERVRHNGRWWLSLRAALRRLDEAGAKTSAPTLTRWADTGTECPWLNGRPVSSEILAGGYNRKTRYYAEADILAVIRAKQRGRDDAPSYPGLTYLVLGFHNTAGLR